MEELSKKQQALVDKAKKAEKQKAEMESKLRTTFVNTLTGKSSMYDLVYSVGVAYKTTFRSLIEKPTGEVKNPRAK